MNKSNGPQYWMLDNAPTLIILKHWLIARQHAYLDGRFNLYPLPPTWAPTWSWTPCCINCLSLPLTDLTDKASASRLPLNKNAATNKLPAKKKKKIHKTTALAVAATTTNCDWRFTCRTMRRMRDMCTRAQREEMWQTRGRGGAGAAMEPLVT